ncbi:MAG: metal-sulfur cluster assembly factor [Candidatus Levybacteria bacterium]|nr:metal-sulfur cluster assembly factor [Candidatus Levybacteria bacterium]
MITREALTEQLKTIIDPELNFNIIDLGLVYNTTIDQDAGLVTITMTLTTPGCPLSFVFEEWIPEAVKKVEGVKGVKIDLVWEPAWDPDKISDEAKEELGLIR